MIDIITIGGNQIEKHYKYGDQYRPSSNFWGLGIEQEVYFEFEKRKEISVKEFMDNHKKERYSVDYYSNYKSEILFDAFRLMYKTLGSNVLFVPVLLNSHSFSKTDIYNKSKTLYTKDAKPNPEFSGITLIEYLELKDKYFDQKNPTWIFDGDTVEFISTSFYNAKLSDILEELESNSNTFIQKLNFQLENIDSKSILRSYGKIKIMEKNHSFATYLTNYDNICMFNNGTIHLNITLPTKLNEKSQISNKKKFIEKHKKAIKMIQWFEPLIIAVYCSQDPFSILKPDDKCTGNFCFSACSQRNAISRYISIGTYSTDKMESGKILTKPIDQLEVSKLDYWWYNRFHSSSGYNKLEQIGLDINFNKHWNHGIEIRFLDYISDKKLVEECWEFIIYLMDLSLESNKDELENPIITKEFNDMIYNIMCVGINYSLKPSEIKVYEKICSFRLDKTNVIEVYYELLDGLRKKFNKEFIETKESDHLYKNIKKVNKIIVPTGIFSSLVLDTKYIHIEKKNKENLTLLIKQIDEQLERFDCYTDYFKSNQSNQSNQLNQLNQSNQSIGSNELIESFESNDSNIIPEKEIVIKGISNNLNCLNKEKYFCCIM